MAFRILNTRLDWMAEADKPAAGEVLVLPANDHLWMLSGPGLELKKALGKELELEAVRQGPVEPGALVVTSGEGVGFRFLFHAVVMGQDLQWIRGAGTRAVASVLERAGKEKISSLHVHPLFRGIHGRREEPAREMLDAFLEGLEAGSPLKSVSILHSGAEEKAFLNDLFVRLLAEPH